ncbi:MAG: leucine-rich repeat domain-containing protein [Lachnospiraceae bacterium]|nr:leucine-rich repeat domain-containing protein [Lachnospiraceae bacterium]
MRIKRIFLQVLVAVLIAAGMRVTANADTIKGKCGDNCRYSYNTGTKEMVISGTGDITDNPWVKASYFHKIKKVTIKNGITALKVKGAFECCRGIETVHMAESVKEVAVRAFSYCVNLKTLTIPGVEVIDRRAFEECSKLSGVEFSKSIRKIGRLAFCGVGFKGELVIKKGSVMEEMPFQI